VTRGKKDGAGQRGAGPGENAGMSMSAMGGHVFKIESQSSQYIEPYQGAATGVGGICGIF
jgi:phosphoribosylformylglycinamidine (FGAM) synthase-like enzyme